MIGSESYSASLENGLKFKTLRGTMAVVLERAPTAFRQNAPSFSRGCVLVTFKKILLPLEKLLLCVSDIRHELREPTRRSRFQNFGFQELSSELSFLIEQSMSMT